MEPDPNISRLCDFVQVLHSEVELLKQQVDFLNEKIDDLDSCIYLMRSSSVILD